LERLITYFTKEIGDGIRLLLFLKMVRSIDIHKRTERTSPFGYNMTLHSVSRMVTITLIAVKDMMRLIDIYFNLLHTTEQYPYQSHQSSNKEVKME